MEFAGLRTTSWVTDTGEVVREESPLGLMTVRESAGSARGHGGRTASRRDLLERPPSCRSTKHRIDDPRDVRRLRMRLAGADLSASSNCRASASPSHGDVLEIAIRRRSRAGAGRSRRARYLAAEPLIESDDPGFVAEAEAAVRGVAGSRAQGRAADAPRQRAAREEADRQPAVGARGAADQGRRLQRAHGALRRDGARARHSRAHRRRSRLHARRVLLPRLARGLYRRGRRPRLVAAGRSDVQPVSGRRDARADRARRPRQAGRDPAADRPAEDGRSSTWSSRPASAPVLVGRRPTDIGAAVDPAAAARHRRLLVDPATAAAAPPMIAIHDLVKRYGALHGGRRRQPRRPARARSTASSARTAPARRRRSG